MKLRPDTFDGQCECKPGFGGRQCNECMAKFFGDPKVECRECKCDVRGSKSLQCDMKTGACRCLPGIGGYNCNECDRGYLGLAPDCIPCGECFDNWDRILQETKNQTLKMIERAGDIKKVGATGAYTKEFDDMQFQIDEIEQLLSNTHEVNVDAIEQELQNLRSKINKTETGSLKELDLSIASTKEKILLTELKLNSLKQRIDDLKNKTKELEMNGTQLQEANVQGALTLIQEAKKKADMAAGKAERIQISIDYAERQIKATESNINETAENFKQQLQNNEKKLEDLRTKLSSLKQVMPELNELICDGRGDPCDSICGGAGCGTCGASIPCEDGAKQQAETALSLANSTEAALRNKEAIANDFVRNVSQINTNETRNIAQNTFDKARAILIEYNNTVNSANNLENEIRDFLAQNNTKPEDIKKLADQVLAKKIHLEPDEITTLANQIKDAVSRLTDIDSIIKDTRDDLRRVNQLKENAENAKSNATDILSEAAHINKTLEDISEAQANAQIAIKKALDDISTVNTLLDTIGDVTKTAQNKTSTTTNDIKRLEDQLNQLQRNITDNGIYAERVANESENILQKAKEAYSGFNDLQTKYSQTQKKLNMNLNKVQSSKQRAHDLVNRALKLYATVTKTGENISKLELNSQENHLKSLEAQLQELLRRMDGYTKKIQERLNYYKMCN
ncbi:Laminin EGF, Prominin, and/or AAA 13 domain containing protein [Asbolus verrucosus]|uniref:Laminin EGF, Prominin, and/or AAA 13 domain containing protein n=1 Tax=Asbolus verrucosus TaxID=1661398 RepID=A0A482V9H5_ASBVE|nr:Laminin EGF, Prominin, and/or AAA 13 domain containing protein [Asbolus verrucosus]